MILSQKDMGDCGCCIEEQGIPWKSSTRPDTPAKLRPTGYNGKFGEAGLGRGEAGQTTIPISSRQIHIEIGSNAY